METPTLSGALSVSSYDNHVCVLTKTGGVKCWGYGDQGKLGAGNNNDAHTASDVSLGSDTAIQVSVGWSHTCAVLANGKVKCWGDGANGKLGVGNTTDYNTPQVVKVNASTDLSGVRQIGAGYFITCGAFGKVQRLSVGETIGTELLVTETQRRRIMLQTLCCRLMGQ